MKTIFNVISFIEEKIRKIFGSKNPDFSRPDKCNCGGCHTEDDCEEDDEEI